MLLSRIPKLPFYLDPFVLFCVLGIVLPPLRLGLSFRATLDYFFNDYLIGCMLVGVLVVFVTHTFKGSGERASEKQNALSHDKLSSFDAWRARWYLLNSCVWHMYFDGLVGAFKVNQASAFIAGKIDKRYAAPLFEKYGAGIHTICLIELCVMTPLGFLTYYAFYRRKSWRAAAEVAFSSFQIMGTLAWILEEALTGFTAFFEYDKKFELTEERLTYFWFATVFGGFMYIAVPLLCIVTAASQMETIVPPPSRSVSLVRPEVASNAVAVVVAAKTTSRVSKTATSSSTSASPSPRKSSRASSKKK